MTTDKKRVAILISGRGSNMCALLDAAQAPNYPAAIQCVIANRADAGGLAIAEQFGVKSHVIDHKHYDGREAFDAAINKVLAAEGIDLVCLAGFMRLLTPGFVDIWRDRMINIHPSLLPSFKGLNTHQRALDAGVKLAGCTVHFVRSDMDDGPIIIQAAVPVLDTDTEDTLAARVLKAEHEIYPKALDLVCRGAVQVEGERVFATGSPNTPSSTDALVHWGA